MQSLHLPVAHIDLKRICHNFKVLKEISTVAKAEEGAPYAMAAMPEHFGKNHEQGFVWPAQLAVIKSDAYGHGQSLTAKALMEHGVDMFASGSVQECMDLRQNIGQGTVILNLLGPLDAHDINICVEQGIIPLIHSHDQLELLSNVTKTLPIAIKCNTGMSRLGFDPHELAEVIKNIKLLPHILPVLALSHLHSADSIFVQEEIKTQGLRFAAMVEKLRQEWPSIAISLANSAGTMFAEDIKKYIGPHICRPGIALYGSNPFYGTEFEIKAKGLCSTMWVSAPILSTRTLYDGHGIGYGHTFVAEQDLDIAIIGCGYADGFSRGLTHKTHVCIEDTRCPLVGRVAMQMIFANISHVSNKKPQEAWLLGGPYKTGISLEELAKAWGTISYEVLCMLGNNIRQYEDFN